MVSWLVYGSAEDVEFSVFPNDDELSVFYSFDSGDVFLFSILQIGSGSTVADIYFHAIRVDGIYGHHHLSIDLLDGNRTIYDEIEGVGVV